METLDIIYGLLGIAGIFFGAYIILISKYIDFDPEVNFGVTMFALGAMYILHSIRK